MDYGEIAENAEFAEQKRKKAPRNASGAISANGGASNGWVQMARMGFVAGGWIMASHVMDRPRWRYRP